MKHFEPFFYESLPYIYAVISLLVLIYANESIVMKTAAALLAGASGFIFYSRYKNRLNPKDD